MLNVTIDGKNISKLMEEKAFKLLKEEKYKDAYELLLQLKERNSDLDKVNFALGFICELEAVEGVNIELAQLYYTKAMEFGSIEAKIRMAFLAEKGKISNNYEAYSLYKETVDYYRLSKEKLSHDELVLLEKNMAFVYYRLGKIYEKSMILNDEWHIKEKNLNDALEAYTVSRRLYSKHNLNNLDKAKVLNKIGWLRYTIFLEKNDWNGINKPPRELKIIEKIFNRSEELGNKEATVGLLNIQAATHSFINYTPYLNIELAKSLINKALNIEPNHLPTLLLAAEIETIVPTYEDHKLALDFIRRALKIDSANQKVRKKFDEIIGYQSRYFANSLEQELKNSVKEIIKNAVKKGASHDTKNKSQRLQEIFFPEGYISANWLTKQTYTQMFIDKHFEDNMVRFVTILVEIINTNKLFIELYQPADQKNLSKQIVNSLLDSDTNINLIKFIVKTDKINQLEKDHLDQKITSQFKLFYNLTNNTPKENLLFTREEHQWINAQEEFIKLFCEKFRIGRNAIESIAKGKALAIPDSVGKLKDALDRGMILLNVPPLSYLGNTLGGNSWLYALTTFVTDYVYNSYKQAIISSFVEMDKILPRGEDASNLILMIAKEIASKYSPQIANIKDYKSLDLLTEVTIERIMSYVIAETSMVKYIKEGISNKINKALNFVRGNTQELKAVNAKQLLYEGIWYGKSSNEDRRIQTFTEQQEFGDNWIIDEIWEKTGIITKDKRIFGNVENIKKYGCAIGDDLDLNIRKLQPIDQSKLNLELKEILDNTYAKQIKINLIVEQRLDNNKNKLENSKNMTNDKTYNLLFAKGMISIGLVFLILSVMIMFIPLLSVFSSIAPGLILSGGLLLCTGIIFGKNVTDSTREKDNNYQPSMNSEDKAPKGKEIKKEKIKGPTPLDGYNMQNGKDDKFKAYSMLR